MNAPTGPNRRGQFALVALLAALGLWLVFCAVLPGTGWSRNPLVPWQTWPSFDDLRILLRGVEVARNGLDPIHADPLYNYPPLWLRLGILDIGPGDTIAAGLILNGLFLLCIGWICWRIASARANWGWSALICCPPLMLATERANNDLVIFMLVAVAAAWPRARSGLAVSSLLVGLAALLKLYPLAALGALPAMAGSHLRIALGLLVLACGTYFLANARPIGTIVAKTPKVSVYSYGVTTPFARIEDRRPQFAEKHATLLRATRYGAIAGAALLVAVAFLAGRRRAEPSPAQAGYDETPVRWYQAGALVFLFTYLFFLNWEYRLIFLLLCLPLLHRLTMEPANRRRSLATLAGIALVTWGTAWPGPVPFAIVQGLITPVTALLLAYESGRQPLAPWTALVPAREVPAT